MPTVLITGGSGMVGKRLTEMLLEKGYEVSILSRGSKPSDEASGPRTPDSGLGSTTVHRLPSTPGTLPNPTSTPSPFPLPIILFT